MTIHLCFNGVGLGGVRTSVFLEVLDSLDGDPDVALSFDGGHREHADIVVPALEQRDRVASFFVPAGSLGGPARLTAADLRDMTARGMSIGSNGWSRMPWRGLTTADSLREFVDARIVLQNASGGLVTTAALPPGRYDREALRRLRNFGYRTVYTSDRSPFPPESWMQARYRVTADDSAGSVAAVVRRWRCMRDARTLAKSFVRRIR